MCARLVILMAFALATLSACGHSENAENAPGFINGKSASAYIKIGKPYTVNGRTYYPEHDPEYSEEGGASWYGPGFHGRMTANGETYDKYAMTAAHKTLPMPSIVRVTHLKTEKQVVVRINDRGPFVSGRIIDLSKAAAEQIGMMHEGIAPVKVEYLPAESTRYADLLVAGKRPSDIDLDSDVLAPVQFADTTPAEDPSTISRVEAVQVADLETPSAPPAKTSHKRSVLDRLNPIQSAHAEPLAIQTIETDTLPPLESIPESLPPAGVDASKQVSPAPAPVKESSPPPARVESAAPSTSVYDMLPRTEDSPKRILKPTSGIEYFVSLGSYSNAQNIAAIEKKFTGMPIEKMPVHSNGKSLTRVRIGPLDSAAEATRIVTRAQNAGISDAQLVTSHH